MFSHLCKEKVGEGKFRAEKEITMSDFYSHPRTLQSLNSQHLQDEIYRTVLNAKSINRPQGEDDPTYELDLLIGVDCSVSVLGGMVLTIQEKALSHKYAGFNSISVEYYQNPLTKEHGDWWNLRADLYLCSYLAEDGNSLDRWCLLDWSAVKLSHCKVYNRPIWSEADNQNDGARASFRYIDANNLYEVCPDAFIAQYGMLRNNFAQQLEAKRNRALSFDDEI